MKIEVVVRKKCSPGGKFKVRVEATKKGKGSFKRDKRVQMD